MKITVILPPELMPVKKALEEAFEQSVAEVATGTRLEYSAGRLAMVSELIDTLEVRYDPRQKQEAQVA